MQYKFDEVSKPTNISRKNKPQGITNQAHLLNQRLMYIFVKQSHITQNNMSNN